MPCCAGSAGLRGRECYRRAASPLVAGPGISDDLSQRSDKLTQSRMTPVWYCAMSKSKFDAASSASKVKSATLSRPSCPSWQKNEIASALSLLICSFVRTAAFGLLEPTAMAFDIVWHDDSH